MRDPSGIEGANNSHNNEGVKDQAAETGSDKAEDPDTELAATSITSLGDENKQDK